MQLTNASNSSGQGHHTARLNRLIQMALMSGLIVSMVLMLIGTVLYFFHNTAGGAISMDVGSLLPGMAAGNPLAFMVLGIIVLMVTPALRVAVAALGYLLDGDWVFALVSAGVVVVLTASVLIGAS
jgi:uncharacterized membrane protein